MRCTLLILLLIIPLVSAEDWTINGDCVYVNDSNVYINACPHTLTDTSGSFNITLISKKYSGSIDAGVGTSEGIALTGASRYSPHSVPDISERFECTNYTVSGGRVTCYDWWYCKNHTLSNNVMTCDATELASDGSHIQPIYNFSQYYPVVFDFTMRDGNMFYKNTSHIDPWVKFGDVRKITLQKPYLGADKWFISEDNIIQNETAYTLNIRYTAPINTEGKYSFCVKPSNEALGGAHTYCLDPWWNNSWSYVRNITIGAASRNLTGYQIGFWISNYTGMESNWASLRFVNSSNDTLPYFLYWSNTTNAYVHVRLPTVNSTESQLIYMYYGNAAAASTSNGSTTYDVFDDFEDGSIGAMWTIKSGTGTYVEANGVLNNTCPTYCDWWIYGDGGTRMSTPTGYVGLNISYEILTNATENLPAAEKEGWGPFIANDMTTVDFGIRVNQVQRRTWDGLDVWAHQYNDNAQGNSLTLNYTGILNATNTFFDVKVFYTSPDNYVAIYNTTFTPTPFASSDSPIVSNTMTGITGNLVGVFQKHWSVSHSRSSSYENFIVRKALRVEPTVTIGDPSGQATTTDSFWDFIDSFFTDVIFFVF